MTQTKEKHLHILSVQGGLKGILTSASHPFEQGCQLHKKYSCKVFANILFKKK